MYELSGMRQVSQTIHDDGIPRAEPEEIETI